MSYWKIGALCTGLLIAVGVWKWSANHHTLYTIALLGALTVLLAIHRYEQRRLAK